MKPGTPGFKSVRLREARLAQGYTGAALASELGVSRQVVSQYEAGDVTPGPQVLEDLARVLKVSPRFFLHAPDRAEVGSVYYRSLKRATKVVRNRAVTKLGWLKEIVRFVEGSVELPTPDIPEANIDPLTVSDRDIERIALDVRKHFDLGFGPIKNMVLVLENGGAIVSRYLTGSETIDAFSEWSVEEGRPYVLLSADKESAVRSRLDAAHELGHMVLHRNVPQRVLDSPQVHELLETQAFRFAGAFLLPAREFSDDFFLPELGELLRLKKQWRVSMSAIIVRCRDLDLLPASEIRRLYVAMGRHGWRTAEPLDDELQPEEPQLLAEGLKVILTQTPLTRADVLRALPMPAEELESLSGLPAGFLEPAEQKRARPEIKEGDGNVVRFPGRSPRQD
jgi:Zn-dependent peptidase ImmA (M78 family)/DNA-binding XRE family transcriptional regulator